MLHVVANDAILADSKRFEKIHPDFVCAVKCSNSSYKLYIAYYHKNLSVTKKTKQFSSPVQWNVNQNVRAEFKIKIY